MSWPAPNLARAPFENLRPVRRISILIAGVAAVLTAWNASTWVRSGASSAEKSAELDRLRTETASASERITTLEQDLIAADLDDVNAQVEFLNDWIDHRTFSWNRMLDRLVEAMPPGVRVSTLAPQRGDKPDGRRFESGDEEETVPLRIRGEAEDDEALLEFVDRLFAHPLFGRPDLARETRRGSGEATSFDLAVAYRPRAETPPREETPSGEASASVTPETAP